MTNSTPVLPTTRPLLARGPFPEIWKRSLIAIFGLGLSFAAALFSTVTREAGNLAATAILAGSSLLISVWVGVTIVPYLARRVASGARWQDAIDFEVTRAGIVYVLTTLLIGVAALNTGNNLLYLIISTMLAAVLVSGVASSLVLRGLTLNVSLPRHVFAGEIAAGSLELRNSRRWLPSLSISLTPPKNRKAKKRLRTEPGTFGFPPNRPPERQWLSIKDLKIRIDAESQAPPSMFQETIHFSLIPARSSAKSELELCFQRRGLYRQDAFALVTMFPFGLLAKRRALDIDHELIVYPAVNSTAELAHILPAIASDMSSTLAGTGQDLLRIRPYEAGDSARHVDWKATAKSGALKVREFARDEQTRLRIIFDNPAPGDVSAESYERGIRLAASLAWYFARASNSVSFAGPGFAASSNVWDFLRYLALAEPAAHAATYENLTDTGELNLVVTASAEASLPPGLRARSRLCHW